VPSCGLVVVAADAGRWLEAQSDARGSHSSFFSSDSFAVGIFLFFSVILYNVLYVQELC